LQAPQYATVGWHQSKSRRRNSSLRIAPAAVVPFHCPGLRYF